MGTLDSGSSRSKIQASPTPFHWALNGPGHAVQFYQDDAHLCRVVANFLVDGINVRQPVVVIATREHGETIEGNLQRHGVAVDSLKSSGDLVIIDARCLLAEFLIDGVPDSELFRTIVGGLLERAGARRRVVRAYGEMVDLLWKANNSEGALQLERLWNSLSTEYHFALLCGYAIGNFMSPAHVVAFEDVCGLHQHVVPADRPSTLD
jgi:hypothetical protein